MRVCVAFVIACLFIGSAAAQADDDIETVASLLELIIDADETSARQCLTTLSAKLQTGEVGEKQREALKTRLSDSMRKIVAQDDHALHFDATILAASWGDAHGLAVARKLASDTKLTSEKRGACVDALIAARDKQALDLVGEILRDEKATPQLRGQVLASLGRSDDPQVASVVLVGYDKYEADLKPKAIELLTQRPAWSKSLLTAIGENKIPASALNVNQVGKLLASTDPELKKLVTAKWGAVRLDRNPQREKVVAEMRERFKEKLGDAAKGQLVFQKVCGQCHKIYGEGHDVGPDITLNGRASFEQLLSNVFDPSLVIGASYQARQVATTDGRVLTGLLAEENEQRVVLKIQGGKVETIPRDEIEEITVSQLSLMPEGLENQLKPEELRDLFAFILLDRPPSDRAAKWIPGSPVGK